MPVLQWSERHVVDRPANMHQNALIFVVPAVALLTPWMQNSFKIVENHRWQHVICRRSCPPRGGPIRSVLSEYIVFIISQSSQPRLGNCAVPPQSYSKA